MRPLSVARTLDSPPTLMSRKQLSAFSSLAAIIQLASSLSSSNDLYKQLRKLPARTLWQDEVPKFNALSSAQREKSVAVIRAVGVRFKNAEDEVSKQTVLQWLLELLEDPSEKIRRYAITAIPKVGGSGGLAETRLLSMYQCSSIEREKQAIAEALSKIGGEATTLVAHPGSLLDDHRIRARVARRQSPSAILLDSRLPSGLRVHLRCRRGLEQIVADEVRELSNKLGLSHVETLIGCVVVDTRRAMRLADLFSLRCYDTLGFVLQPPAEAKWGMQRLARSHQEEAIAATIASTKCEELMRTCTSGALRYRLHLDVSLALAASTMLPVSPPRAVGKPRAPSTRAIKAMRERISRASYALNPRILADGRQAVWIIEAFSHEPLVDGPQEGVQAPMVELQPRVTPNPRLAFQTATFYAGAHPSLAACMARMARPWQPEGVVWDPFCGTGLELIESSLANPSVLRLVGTDIDATALNVARANVESARYRGILSSSVADDFHECDFRKGPELVPEIAASRVSLIITNPPLGRRVKVANLHALFYDLFNVAARTLSPDGRMVFINPLRVQLPRDLRSKLMLEQRSSVDLKLRRDCSVEVYRRIR